MPPATQESSLTVICDAAKKNRRSQRCNEYCQANQMASPDGAHEIEIVATGDGRVRLVVAVLNLARRTSGKDTRRFLHPPIRVASQVRMIGFNQRRRHRSRHGRSRRYAAPIVISFHSHSS